MAAPQLRAVSSDDPSPPDASRARLRDAIARVTAAEEAVKLAETARGRVHGQFLSALRSLDIARDALRAAVSDNQAHRVAVLMGEAQTGPALSDLRRAVELSETVAAGARSDEALLDDEINRRRQQLDFAIIARSTAIGDVLRPVAAGLLTRLRTHLTAAAALRGALRTLPSDCLENFWDSQRTYPEDISMNARWRDVVATLANNADAPIPETE
jgi:hypothetical protein